MVVRRVSQLSCKIHFNLKSRCPTLQLLHRLIKLKCPNNGGTACGWSALPQICIVRSLPTRGFASRIHYSLTPTMPNSSLSCPSWLLQSTQPVACKAQRQTTSYTIGERFVALKRFFSTHTALYYLDGEYKCEIGWPSIEYIHVDPRTESVKAIPTFGPRSAHEGASRRCYNIESH